MGDGLSLTVSSYTNPEQHERLWSATSRDSFGLFFEVLTEAFGFVPCRDEGKLTGLAAHGDPAHITDPRPFSFSDGTLAYTGPYGKQGVRWAKEHLLRQYSREDIAAWAQDILESLVVETAQAWLRKTGHTKLAAAGGVFANVKLNQRLHELPEVESLFVCPNMGDGGLSLGAICECGGLTPQRIEHVFLGDAFTDDEMRAALERVGLPAEPCDNIETQCAQMVAEDKVVARFTGAMEWGPRALGNRSILARTTDPAVHERLNTLLSRSDFMPFAPAMLDEEADRYLLNYNAGLHAAEFMTVCFDCTEEMQREHAAVVHVDKTARAQLVRETTNPAFYRILKAYKDITGHGVLLNTSFNIHEEPIVCTPDEAVSTFLRSKLDYLALGPYFVKQPQS
jgi:carbamoyltransferase